MLEKTNQYRTSEEHERDLTEHHCKCEATTPETQTEPKTNQIGTTPKKKKPDRNHTGPDLKEYELNLMREPDLTMEE